MKNLTVILFVVTFLAMKRTLQTPYGAFEWDSQKEALNIQKHGLDFALATEVFADDCAIFESDTEHSYGEERMRLLGSIGEFAVVLVVFTERDVIRIISARKATKKEREFYVQYTR